MVASPFIGSPSNLPWGEGGAFRCQWNPLGGSWLASAGHGQGGVGHTLGSSGRRVTERKLSQGQLCEEGDLFPPSQEKGA